MFGFMKINDNIYWEGESIEIHIYTLEHEF